MSTPLIENGVVTIDAGRITAVGRFGSIDAAGSVTDLGDVVLLPGLINAHTHLELSNLRPAPTKPTSFGAWALELVRSQGRSVTEPEITASVAAGVAESLGFGVTTVGDITRSPAVSRSALRASPLRVVSFGEVRAMAQRRMNLRPQLDVAIDRSLESDRLRVGVSPHAPYSIEPDGYRACLRAAREQGLPICTHLAESPDEQQFLSEQAGPLREVWDFLESWSDDVPRWAGSPVAFARSVGLLDGPSLLAHVNYASDADLDLLAASSASVVYCPRTHAYFGHPPHRWREMLARGINVCVGTDSRASSPDLNLVDDLRLMYQQMPDVEPSTLWELVTTRAAGALERHDVGGISAGLHADLVAFPATGAEPLRDVLASAGLPSQVWVAGEPQHPSS